MEVLGVPVTLTSALLVVLVLLLTYTLWTWNIHVHYWVKRGIPGPTPLPIVGNLFNYFSKSVLELDLDYVKKYGNIVGEYYFTPSIFIADANIAKQVLVTEFRNYEDRAKSDRELSEHDVIASRMLNNLQGDEWKQIRNTIRPAFSSSKLRLMVNTMNKCCDILIESLSKTVGEQIAFRNVTDGYTMDTIAQVGFGVNLDSQRDPKNQFIVNGRKIFQFSFNWQHPEMFLTAFCPWLFKILCKYSPNTFSIFPRKPMDFFISLIRKIMTNRGEQKGNLDMIQLMLNAHNMHEKPGEIDSEIGGSADKSTHRRGLTEEEVLAQSFLLMIAGFDTTSSSLSFLAYNLATNPECQRKLQQQIDAVIGDAQTITYEMTRELLYLDMCMDESLRLYPPAARVERQSKNEMTLGGVTIPADITVGISVAALHYNSDIWPEPRKYDPERFSPEAKAQRDPIYYIPFGYGPRNCIGMRLAQMEIKIAIIKILQKFNIKTCEKTQIPLKLEAGAELTTPDTGIYLILERRQ